MHTKREIFTDKEFSDKRYWSSQHNYRQILEVIETYQEYTKDPDKVLRTRNSTCRVCCYAPLIAGSALSSSNCQSCEKTMQSGCTYISPLCLDCAKSKGVCKMCLCDLKVQERDVKKLIKLFSK